MQLLAPLPPTTWALIFLLRPLLLLLTLVGLVMTLALPGFYWPRLLFRYSGRGWSEKSLNAANSSA